MTAPPPDRDSSDDPVLWLADWRRRVAGLYAEVRAVAESDPLDAWHLWRTTREQLYREHPQSPVPFGRRRGFHAIHFPYDSALRFDSVRVELESAPSPGPALLPVSDGAAMDFRRIGALEIPFPTGSRRLAIYWMAGYAGGLFLPFRDATNGTETYAAGRYLLDAAKGADLGGDAEAGSLVIDFNFAFQPSCAFDPRWACPLPSPENHLDMSIRAGERIA